MITLASYEADLILSKVGPGQSIELNINDSIVKVRTNSVRLRLFKDNKKCVCCGIEGVLMLLQKHQTDDTSPHFNLYALTEYCKPLLMTKDHILPRSKNGKDDLSNLQTMCCKCNELKGNNHKLTFEEIIKLKSRKNNSIEGMDILSGTGKRKQGKNRDAIAKMALQQLIVKTYDKSSNLNEHIFNTIYSLDDKNLMSLANKQRWSNQLESILKYKGLV